MKQYTTPTVTIRVGGQELLLQAADRVVVSFGKGGNPINIEGERLSIVGDTISATLTTEETAALGGTSSVEVTIFTDGEVHKTKTMRMSIDESVWNNAD